jgi:hypothetical protein
MKTRLAFPLLLFAVVGTTLPAQAADAGDPQVRPGIPVSEGEMTPNVLRLVRRGDSLRAALRFAEAQQAYTGATEIARREGHLPSRSMWLLANAYFNDGNTVRAAAVMDQLTNEAGRVGDLPVQALAMFNAAWLNGQAGRTSEATSRVTRLERLLRSPYMPVAIRDHLTDRLKPPSDLATSH